MYICVYMYESASHGKKKKKFEKLTTSFFIDQCLLLLCFQAFDSSICKDEHLAVAFFQRAVTFYKMTRQDIHQ